MNKLKTAIGTLNSEHTYMEKTKNFSFDEKLLLDMFKEIISAKLEDLSTFERCDNSSSLMIKKSCYEYNQDEYNWILDNVFYERHNIKLLEFDIEHARQSLSQLVDAGILSLSEPQIEMLSCQIDTHQKGKYKFYRDDDTCIIDMCFSQHHFNPNNSTMYNVKILYNDNTDTCSGDYLDNTVLLLVNKPYYGGDNIYKKALSKADIDELDKMDLLYSLMSQL
jgi:hypothetical protein